MRTFCLSLFVIMACGYTSASPLKTGFEYYGEADSLHKLLTALASNAEIGINIAANVDDNFNGHLQYSQSDEALNYLASAYDLIWYFDGATLYVNRSRDQKSQMLRLQLITPQQLKQTMQSLHIWDARFEWRTIEHNNILMVSGPPRYIELVNQTVALLQDNSNPNVIDPLAIRLFKLKYASAVDRQYEVRGEKMQIPGVATLLQGMLQKNNTSAVNTPIQLQDENNAPITEANAVVHQQVSIQAEPSLNAVIIQDYRSRIDMYAQLIQQLDVPRAQLEISLVIIDLTINSLQEVGIDWATKKFSVGKGIVDLILPGANATDPERLITTNADFLATVSLLETQGKARITSRPAVVTENGLQAMLDNNESFFIRVAGERVAEIEEITYGTLLQVTPRIVNQANQKHIYMDVNIQDGNRIDDGGPDSLPSIKNTLINTRAQIPEGASLLVGGYSRQVQSDALGQVPGVGDLPVLGKLFQHNRHNHQQMVRLFMLSPKIMHTHPQGDGTEQLTHHELNPEQQVKQLSRVSNQNGHIINLMHRLPCETAIEARARRNHFISMDYRTQMFNCVGFDQTPGFQVQLLACPQGATEAECL